MTVIAHLSDLHLGKDRPGVLEALVADVAAARPDATVVTGDITMRARRAEFERAKEVLDQLPPPVVVVLGNHDVPLFALHERALRPYARFRRYLGPDIELDPAVDAGGARILGLQSMPRWRWKAGRVSLRQAGLVERVLGGAPDGALRVLALHHPVSLGGAGRLARRGLVRAAVAAAGVDVVLAGHTHIPRVHHLDIDRREGASRRVLEVVCGTSGSARTRGAPGSWMLVRSDERQIGVTTNLFEHSGWRAEPEVVYPRQPR